MEAEKEGIVVDKYEDGSVAGDATLRDVYYYVESYFADCVRCMQHLID